MSRRKKRKSRFFYTPSDDAWLKVHPEFSTRSKTIVPITCTHLMECSNEYFQSSAVWRRKDGAWSCIQAGENLKWMIGLDPVSAKVELARRGCDWKWLDVNDRKNGELDPDTATVGGSVRSEAGGTTEAALGTVNRGCPALP